MAAIVCHGLQSSLESQLVESRIHGLIRLSSPKPLTPQPIDLAFNSHFCEENSYKTNTTHHSNPNQGGWSFLQAVSNVSQSLKDNETTTYVPPQVKQSSVRLSPKSLELCTENLGNETGTDDIMDNNGTDLLSSSSDCAGTREQKKSSSSQLLGAKKAKTQNFPPPLTTIRGAESLQMRPHREGGRLVIEVMKVPPSASCFQAERSHGRLRLSFFKSPPPSFDEEEDDDNEGFDEELESEMNGQTQDAEEDAEETEEEAEIEGVENNDDERDTCGSNWSIGCGMRMEKYERGSRCKEGGHEKNINWGEPLWVTSS